MSKFKTISRRDKVWFAGCGMMYVSPEDKRGALVLNRAGVTQAEVTWTWRMLVRAISPEIVIDIGANYGEIGFSAKYGGAVVVMIEANEKLANFLRKSAQRRVYNKASVGDTFHVVQELVSDRNEPVRFLVDDEYSGYSSVSTGDYEEELTTSGRRAEWRTTRTVDDIIQDIDIKSDGNVLFKIDVEGHEPCVISGMMSLLDRSRKFAGIVEYSEDAIEMGGGGSAVALLEMLIGLGDVYLIRRGRSLLRVRCIEDIRPKGKRDLLIVTRGVPLAHDGYPPYWFLPRRVLEIFDPR